jgi:hypothetical protein
MSYPLEMPQLNARRVMKAVCKGKRFKSWKQIQPPIDPQSILCFIFSTKQTAWVKVSDLTVAIYGHAFSERARKKAIRLYAKYANSPNGDSRVVAIRVGGRFRVFVATVHD